MLYLIFLAIYGWGTGTFGVVDWGIMTVAFLLFVDEKD